MPEKWQMWTYLRRGQSNTPATRLWAATVPGSRWAIINHVDGEVALRTQQCLKALGIALENLFGLQTLRLHWRQLLQSAALIAWCACFIFIRVHVHGSCHTEPRAGYRVVFARLIKIIGRF